MKNPNERRIDDSGATAPESKRPKRAITPVEARRRDMRAWLDALQANFANTDVQTGLRLLQQGQHGGYLHGYCDLPPVHLEPDLPENLRPEPNY